MFAQLAKLERRFLEIESLLAQPDVGPQEFRRLSKERSELEEPVALFREHLRLLKDLEETRELVRTSSGDMYDMCFQEMKDLEARRAELEQRLTLELIPKDPNDSRNVILEVRAGAGGDEASLFAGELFRAYSRYADTQRWKTEVLSMSENELGGLKEVIALFVGDNVYRRLKYESGVHRVQRVPSTEAQGRVHTSTVTVAVLPEAEDVDVTVNDSDLRVDTYRASGAGGQHVNRTDSAVRITHLPSGIVVACQDERSQIKNKARALKVLQAKLLEAAQVEQDKALSAERRAQVGRGDRSERIRTYNFPQSRVTDHRMNLTIHSISAFMEGEMDPVIEPLQAFYQAEAMRMTKPDG